MADYIRLTHKTCGGHIATVNAVDDRSTIEIMCPRCRGWVEVYSQAINECLIEYEDVLYSQMRVLPVDPT